MNLAWRFSVNALGKLMDIGLVKLLQLFHKVPLHNEKADIPKILVYLYRALQKPAEG